MASMKRMTTPTEAIQKHLDYLDAKVVYCTANANLFKGSTSSADMSLSASVYADAAVELRNTLLKVNAS
jgi:hypothetical protein